MRLRTSLWTSVIVLLACFADGQTLSGTVKNATTGKPAAGDEVVLLKLGQGMEESGRTKTNTQGKFTFKLDDTQAPHLVRAIHGDVTYHHMAPPGTTSVDVDVYDVAKKVEGIEVVADIMRLQAAQGQLQIVREFGVQNSSTPPRTQMNEHNLEFYIPDGAQVLPDSATATTENGNPLRSAPVPEGEKNRYSFIFPLRPGLTQFEVTYTVGYSGSANLDPKSVYSLQHFVVLAPKTMQFAAASPGGFKLTTEQTQPDANVQVASNTTPGQNLAFKVSGEGTLQDPQESTSGQQGPGNNQTGDGDEVSAPGAGNSQSDNRPGGGLGVPIDAPDPLQKYRWWLLGGFAAVLAMGAVYVASRQQSAARSLKLSTADSRIPALVREEDNKGFEAVGWSASRNRIHPNSFLMEGIKEELFQLEIEHKQGQISAAEYDKARAALDQTLERALKRQAKRA